MIARRIFCQYRLLSRGFARGAGKPDRTIRPLRVPSADTLAKATIDSRVLNEYLANDDPLLHEDYFKVAEMFTIQDLFKARVHLGHKIGTVNDNMKWALYGHRMGVCIFDLEITRQCLIRALNFVAHIAYRGGVILFISSNRENQLEIERIVAEMGEYSHVRKWRESTLTDANNSFGSEIRLPDTIVFIGTLTTVFDSHPALVEAAKLTIPTVGIVDSNASPNYVSFPVPGNDDSRQSVQLYMQLFKKAVLLGKQLRNDGSLNKQTVGASTNEQSAQ